MLHDNYQHFLTIEIAGFIINAATLIYILKNFNIQVHVYTLLFVDSLISTLSALVSIFTIFAANNDSKS
jgi:hypothetical protein